MANNLSKKFALLCSCLMTMQALRLVISTAGFCVVRFHIDPSLFNIFISRLVNAVLMSQLFGNWLGDLFVFGLDGKAKLGAASAANWAEFICFCTALFSIMHTECGHLTGFYWSMVLAYFWWKVGEAPTVGISGGEVDYYFAGFTLSGVWASCLKGLVMRCVTGGNKPLHFNSDALGDVNVKVVGDVNVSVVGARSVKTTVDYRAAKWLYILTIVLTFLMCVTWSAIADKVEQKEVQTGQQKGTGSSATDKEVKEWDSGNLEWDAADDTVRDGNTRHKGFGNVGVVDKGKADWLKWIVGIAFGGVLSVPGAMLGVGVGWLFAKCFKCCVSAASYAKLTKRCQLIFGIVGALGGFAAGAAPMAQDGPSGSTTDKKMGWVWSDKWKTPWWKDTNVPEASGGTKLNATKQAADNTGKKIWEQFAPMIGLAAGLATGFVIGAIVACCKPDVNPYRPLAAGAFFGSFFGLICGEMANGYEQWKPFGDKAVVALGLLINVLGLGTVYSIYPGMAPCSITQFQYFNTIDILILILSSIAPLVIMYGDLGGEITKSWRLGKTVGKAFEPEKAEHPAGLAWILIGLLLLIGTNICEIIVLNIMQHPFSKTAQKVTTSGWRAVLLTVTMVTSQLVSTGVGFGSVAAGSIFNDGWINVNSTAVLWTTECCGVLGEGYLTELKKYEPGKWPTQGMGKWDTYKWWNGKAFGNAWQIWCCIGTTDLRRDIMLCRQ